MSPASTNVFTLSHQSKLADLLAANERWCEHMEEEHPRLLRDYNAHGQSPHTLFIGCSDSRYNEACLGVVPGEIFTWKTIANVITESDATCRATLEFAINVLKVNKVVVCGHTDCGGINTCLSNKRESLLESGTCNSLHAYLQDVDDLYHEHKQEVFAQTSDVKEQSRLLSKLNVQKQRGRLLEISTVKDALARGDIEVYGLLYDVGTGRVEVV
ncbi:LAMI_0E04170g1_1 [Lachancea mirantina]|uniref:Carbonic anhydrase n=1 Tax=Lachancea mirantina TaxID=1230905 RepID=A0A1G4JKH0_9SACH|nr:LAMI_0E04170g1_1 [Lachancea mirantina]